MRRQTYLLSALVPTLMAGLLTPFRVTVVRGESMAPALRSGGLHVLDRLYYRHHPLQRGDIILFNYEHETCVKRVHALPGDRLFLVRYLDGSSDEVVDTTEADVLRRLQNKGRLAGRRVSELTVPPGHLFVLGDNQDVSWDSRSFGFLPVEAVVGRLAN
jgi:signal peptidase I